MREPFRYLGPAGGDPRLGGDVFDRRLFDHMVEHFNTAGDTRPRQRTYPDYIDLTNDAAPAGVEPRAWLGARHDLLERAREYKEMLCDLGLGEDIPQEIVLPEILGRSQAEPLRMTRRQFHELIKEQIEATGREVRRLLGEFGVRPTEIDRVVLAGGSTRVPAVKTLLKSIFDFAPNDTLEPDKAVAIGAAIYDQLRFIIKLPEKTLTVPIGIRVTKLYKESIVGSISAEVERRDFFEEVLPRGTPYLGEATKLVTTVRDNQKTMRFRIYQNDGETGGGVCQPSDLMAWFDLTLPSPAQKPKGQAKVELTFILNGNGTTVDVRAVEKTTNLTVERQIEFASRDKEPPDDEGSGAADIVIAMDTTGSMGPYIKNMQRLTKEFARRVGESGVDYRLALVDYRDVKRRERLNVYPFTTSVEEFQRLVDRMDADGGGDEPESSVDAIERALELNVRPEAQRIIILITDASTHDPSAAGTSLGALADRLQREAVALYVVSKPHLRELYGRLITERGRFYEMGRSFDDILTDVAKEIRDITVV